MVKIIMKNIIRRNEFVIVIMTLILVVVLSTGSNIFWNVNNLNSLQTSIAPNAIVAFGMLLLLVLGVFDLSVGSVMCFVGVFVSRLFLIGVNVPLAILGGLVMGGVLGFFNGMLVSIIGINPLIATIGTKYIIQGGAYILMATQYQENSRFPLSFMFIGSGKFAGFYYQFWIMLTLLIILGLLLRYTFGGRKLYYIGGNRITATKMGFPTRRILLGTFVITGLFCATAALLAIARYGNANRYLGNGVEMTVIIGCILGGASLSGGRGTAFGTLFGVMFMSLMTNFFNLFRVSSTWQNVVIGIILVVVVAIDGLLTLRKQHEFGKI
jgi:ribose/xylose/arabinose/galactoside ABC-type transport system permease subunit